MEHRSRLRPRHGYADATDFFSDRWRVTDHGNGKTDKELHSVSQCLTQQPRRRAPQDAEARSVKSYIFMEHRSHECDGFSQIFL
jgi:hypothetical protein